MPSVKVRDNEPFDVALRAAASTMRSRLLSVNAKRQLP